MDELKPGTIYEAASKLRELSYDIICIGSGWAGRVFAAKLAKNGGECPFYACVPSKALLRSSEALDSAFLVDGAKQQIKSAKVDVAAVLGRRDNLISNRDDTQILVPMVLKAGVDVVRGRGRLVGERTVDVASTDGSLVSLSAIIAVAICTGSSPRMPNIPGLAEVSPWMPKDATGATDVPRSLLILGTGAVGCEMATAYANFGTKVILVGHSGNLLPKMEREAGLIVKQYLEEKLQVEVLLGTSLTKVARISQDEISIELLSGHTFKVAKILVATGRSANVDDIGLESLGLQPLPDVIDVDDSLLVKGIPGQWLYALGDVNGRAPLTHISKYHGRVAASAVLKNLGRASPMQDSRALADSFAIPSVVFTTPQVASVGLTREEAHHRKIEYKFFESPLFSVGSLIHGIPPGEGWASCLIEAKSQRLIGMTLVGRDVGEIIHAGTVAITGGLTLQQLAHAVPSFPTISEVFLNLLEAGGF